MAGSELRGLAGARADLFRVPRGPHADRSNFTLHLQHAARHLARDRRQRRRGQCEDHDRLVAIASHVPHLLAGSLMNEASQVAEQDAVLLQLAAGGFRDMTRIAAVIRDLARHPL